MQSTSIRKLPLAELFLAVTMGIGCLVMVLLLLNLSRPRQNTLGVVTAALTVIPAPTVTPTPPPVLSATPTSNVDAPSGPGAGVLAVGSYVQISGTEGEGLRVREGPGLGYEPLFLALEAEVFEIIDGPQRADEYTWWRLAAPYDESINGWSVENFLMPVDEP